jgi:membrane protease YdiL (CAAX protease family)
VDQAAPQAPDHRTVAGRPPAATHLEDDRRPDRATVWRELGIFLTLQTCLTAATTVLALQQGVDVSRIDEAPPLGQAALYLSALWPAVSALAARRVVHGRFRWAGWGLRRAPWSRLALAWLVALATVLAAGALVVLTGVGGLDLAAGGTLPLLGLTVVVLPYVLLALGEELGWRGLVVTRLAEVAGPRTVVLASGLTWSAFHWPMILVLGGTPEGVSPVFAVAAFTTGLTGLAAVLASMQLRWGIWPVCVAHAVWNATLYQVLEPVVVDEGSTAWFSTETGLALAVTSVVAAALWWRRHPLCAGPAGTTTVPGEPS